jgi:hypothetical protein
LTLTCFKLTKEEKRRGGEGREGKGREEGKKGRREGKEGKGKEKKDRERKGKERKGKERKGKERFNLISDRMAKIKNSGDSICWQGCGERRSLLHCL